MSNVRILDDQPKNRDIWTDYVQRHSEATIDHCWEWRWILESSFGFKPYFIGAFDSDRLTGILPLFHVPCGLGRSALVSIPFGNYGGICADSPDMGSMILEEAKHLMKHFKCLYVALHHRTPVNSDELQSVDDRARFSMPIEDSPETIFARLNRSARRQMRFGSEAEVTINSSRDTGPLYKIHLRKFRRLGTPCFPRAYFDLTLKHFGNHAFIHYAHYRNEVIAFHFVLLFRQSLVITTGGDLEQYRFLHPDYILSWRAIEIAATSGLSEVDMCRSLRNSGPARHKLVLGMREYPLVYQYLVSDKHRLALRSPSDSKFRMASRLWRKIPLGFTQVLGPKIVRYFA